MAMLLDLVQEPTHWRLSVSGNLDYKACSRLRMSVDRILISPPRHAVVDLSRIGTIDGAGLGILVSLSHHLASTCSQLALVTTGEIDTMLTDPRLLGVFTTHASVAEAVLAVEAHGMASTERCARTALQTVL